MVAALVDKLKVTDFPKSYLYLSVSTLLSTFGIQTVRCLSELLALDTSGFSLVRDRVFISRGVVAEIFASQLLILLDLLFQICILILHICIY